jgi:hypothetical protein
MTQTNLHSTHNATIRRRRRGPWLIAALVAISLPLTVLGSVRSIPGDGLGSNAAEGDRTAVAAPGRAGTLSAALAGDSAARNLARLETGSATPPAEVVEQMAEILDRLGRSCSEGRTTLSNLVGRTWEQLSQANVSTTIAATGAGIASIAAQRAAKPCSEAAAVYLLRGLAAAP